MCRQAFCRVQSSAGDGQGQSHVPAPDHAFLPSCSRPHLSIHSSADFNTDLYSFTQCELSMERGETGVRKDRKGQCIRLPRSLGLCLCCFCLWFCYICSGKQRQFETKGLFSKQRAQEEGRKEKEGCVERKSAAQMRVRLLRAQEGINKVTISVHGSQRWGGRPFS